MVGKISCKQDNLVLDACFLVLCQKYLNNASYIFITAVLRKKTLCSVYMVSSSAVIL